MSDAIIASRGVDIVNYSKEWEYTTNSSATLVTKYIGTKKHVTVPSEIDGLPVVLQNNVNSTTGVFANNKNILSVLFSDGVSIANANASNMFYNCRSLESIACMPTNITDLVFTFYYCKNVKNFPSIPYGVDSLSYTFMGCYNMINAPIIPNTVKNLSCTFEDCVRLTSAPEIPEGVINMRSTFCSCRNLTSAPVIPASVKNMYCTFQHCTNMTSAGDILASATNMIATYQNCRNLKIAPNILGNITSLSSTFSFCTNLVTPPNIPESVTSVYAAFVNCSNLITAPNIPANVTSMGRTFEGCTNLTGNIYIKSNRINNTAMTNCFMNTTLPKNVYIPCQGLDTTNNTWNAAFNATYGINGKNGVTVIDDCIFYENDFEYTTNSTATLVTKYVGNRNDVVVPSKINGKPVVLQNIHLYYSSIGGVFCDNTNITSVRFLPGVTFANQNTRYMFINCSNLKSVRGFTSGTINDMSSMFANCSSLTSVSNIPSGVRNMYETFYNCKQLGGNIIIESKSVSNLRFCFADTTRVKKVYLPFNSTTHSTANTYINGVNGVTVYDINTYTG